MADLKAGSTVGGSVIWHQGNFPLSALSAVSNDVYYKTYKVYTEYNKPQATDNDFVSKAQGGTYLKPVSFTEGITFPDSSGYQISLAKNIDISTQSTFTAGMKLSTTFALQTSAGTPFILFNPATGGNRFTVMGNALFQQVFDSSGQVFSPGNAPNKTQVGLGNVENAAQVELNKTTQQSLAGTLTAPNLFSRNPGSEPTHVPQMSQIILKNVVIDFGTY